MVLDKYDKENEILIFKNTYNEPENDQVSQFKIFRTDQNAPEEFFFVHFEIEDMDSLQNVEPRIDDDLRRQLRLINEPQFSLGNQSFSEMDNDNNLNFDNFGEDRWKLILNRAGELNWTSL